MAPHGRHTARGRLGIRRVMRLWGMGLGRIFTAHHGLYSRVRHPFPIRDVPQSLCGDSESELTCVIWVENDEPGVITPGHVFTIEPVVLQGTRTGVWTWPDGWAISTDNGNRGAMFEHTCLVTDKGVDVLTA